MQIRPPQREEKAGFPASRAQHQPRLTSHLLQAGVGKDQAALVAGQARRVLPVSSGCKFTVGQWPSLLDGETVQQPVFPQHTWASSLLSCFSRPLKDMWYLEGLPLFLCASHGKQTNSQGEIPFLKRNKGVLVWSSKGPSFQMAFLSSGCLNFGHNHVTIANE